MNHLTTIIFLFIFIGCSTGTGKFLNFHSGNYDKLWVEYDSMNQFNSDYFNLMTFTLHNRGTSWLNVENITLEFLDNTLDKEVKVVTGQDLGAWLESTQARHEWKGMFAQAQGFTGNSISIPIEDFVKEPNKYKKEELFPNGHLYRTSVIPPGLTIKKWLVVFNRSGKILENATFSITTKDKKNIKFVMGLLPLNGLKER